MSDRPVRTSKAAGKTAAKKAPVKKAPAKKAPVRKAAAKKAPVKKAAAKKAPVKRATPARAKKAAAAVTSTPGEVSIATDAASASGSGTPRRRLKNISEVRHFFRTNDVPICSSARPRSTCSAWTAGCATSPTSPTTTPGTAHTHAYSRPAKSRTRIRERRGDQQLAADQPRGARLHRQPHRPAVCVPRSRWCSSTSETETDLRGTRLRPDPAAASLREHLDSKIVTTQLGNEAGAPSVPNVLTKVKDWAGLCAAAEKAGLGDELVVQTPYGDSGKTTFFISSEADWEKHSEDIIGQEIKVMRRINNRPVAVEAVLTRCGTIVGPFMTELIGYQNLTPDQGGWCGNEMYPEVLNGENRRTATQLVRRLGDRLGPGGLPRLLRGGRPGRHRLGRGIPGRAQSTDQRGVLDHQRHRGGLRRHTAVPVPHPRVHGRRLRPRRRRDQRPLGGAGLRGRLEPDGHEGDRRRSSSS